MPLASTAEIDGMTRAVKVVDVMEGAIRWMVVCILAWCVGFAAGGLEIGEWGFIVRFASQFVEVRPSGRVADQIGLSFRPDDKGD